MADNAKFVSPDLPLSQVAIDFMSQPSMFVADRVLNTVPSEDKHGTYPKFNKESFRLEEDRRADKSPSKRIVSWTAGTGTYSIDTHSLHDLVSEEDRKKAARAGLPNPDAKTVTKLMNKMMLRREYKVSSLVFSSTYITNYTTLSGTDQWSDFTNSSPMNDFQTGIESVEKNSGMTPNICVMGVEVFRKLRRHPQLLDVTKYTRTGFLSEEALAAAIGVDEVIVGKVPYNSAQQGATASQAYMWGKHCLLAYRNPSATSFDEPTFGFIVEYALHRGKPAQAKKWYDEDADADKIEVTTAIDEVISSTEAAYLIVNASA